MPVSKPSFELALRNIAEHGDTDVFPFPLENHWFFDDPTAVIALLEDLDRHFDTWLNQYPLVFDKLLAGVGYVGFRPATQIDPIWNAYLLSLVIEIGTDIEAARISLERQTIFSYRYSPSHERATLFDPDLGWASYHRAAMAAAAESQIVVSTDISDFYSRVYHHRLDNALKQATRNTEVVRRIIAILFGLSNRASYGLPVGGHAARLLAELLLNRTDRLLQTNNIRFLRFVDDYMLFANSREEAQAALVFLSNALMTNEGLTLARSKTRFMTGAECRRWSPLAEPEQTAPRAEKESRSFLRMRLRYDPYSPTAEEDYEALVEGIERFDIAKMLARELRKSRIDEAVVRQLIKAVRFLKPPVRDDAVLSLLENVELLYPLFPTVAILLKQIMSDLSEAARLRVFEVVRDLIRNRSHVILVPTNLAYALRLVAMDRSEETDALLNEVYHDPKTTTMMLRRDVILSMARRRVDYWLSDVIKRFATVTPWEKRALIVASYVLGDEGRHQRDSIRAQLSSVDRTFMEWVGLKNDGRSWEIPL